MPSSSTENRQSNPRCPSVSLVRPAALITSSRPGGSSDCIDSTIAASVPMNVESSARQFSRSTTKRFCPIARARSVNCLSCGLFCAEPFPSIRTQATSPKQPTKIVSSEEPEFIRETFTQFLPAPNAIDRPQSGISFRNPGQLHTASSHTSPPNQGVEAKSFAMEFSDSSQFKQLSSASPSQVSLPQEGLEDIRLGTIH